MLEKYLQMFGNLETDRGRYRYPEITYHRAPHKPFLFLSVMDAIILFFGVRRASFAQEQGISLIQFSRPAGGSPQIPEVVVEF